MEKNLIQKQKTAMGAQGAAGQSINAILNSVLDGEKMRGRFQELLGARTPQFLSSIVSLVNADVNLQKAMYEAPMTVVQAALKAATYDLPIEPSLGYAYVVPFHNNVKTENGSWRKRWEGAFIIGYKGMEQLCLRTGAYARVPDAVDVREGELIRYDRLTGDAEFAWIEDEDEREKLPVIGYAGYFRLKNGAEKTIYMTVKQIENHEKKNRKGEYMTKGWRDDFDAMARKTVLRRLIGKYGLMSIDYRNGDASTMRLAEAVAADEAPTDMGGDVIDLPDSEMVDTETSEVIGDAE